MNSRNNFPQYHGFLVIDKPAGITSFDVVARIRKIFRTRRVGHTGTLDPQATGLMIVCLGSAARLAEYLSASSKTYRAGIAFGLTTSTQDVWGETLTTTPQRAAELTASDIASVLTQFTGDIMQVPPMVSALHHEGRRLYDLAREGIEVERAARPVHISRLHLDHFMPGQNGVVPEGMFTITCSSGTYIRALANDIGEALGCGAAMSSLRRTEVGSSSGYHFELTDAYTLDTLADYADCQPERLQDCLLPLVRAVEGWKTARLTPDQERLSRQGRFIAPEEFAWDTAMPEIGEQCALLTGDGEGLVAIAELRSGVEGAEGAAAEAHIRPTKVLVTEEPTAVVSGAGQE